MQQQMSFNKVTNLAFLAQFVNFLEFVLVNPLSPYFTDSLGIKPSEVGWILGSYALAASVSGIICSSFVDRYDRKKVLLICFSGMMLGTLIFLLSYDFQTLIISRLVSGAFGGPATAITMAILSDFIPDHQRGRALGKVMGAFPMASIIGIPFAIEAGRLYGWKSPYILVLAIELLAFSLIVSFLPNVTSHISKKPDKFSFVNKTIQVIKNPRYLLGLSCSFLVFISFFLIVPNIANLLIYNFHLPHIYLSRFFFVSGVCTFLLIKLTGWLCDKYSSTMITSCITIIFTLAIIGSHIININYYTNILCTLMFMLCISTRNTSVSTVISKIPTNFDRAGFMSLQNSLQNMAGAIGGFLSGFILQTGEAKQIIGLETNGSIAIICALTVPFMVQIIERQYHSSSKAIG